ncbi:unnamed protein product [Lampetra planeri]
MRSLAAACISHSSSPSPVGLARDCLPSGMHILPGVWFAPREPVAVMEVLLAVTVVAVCAANRFRDFNLHVDLRRASIVIIAHAVRISRCESRAHLLNGLCSEKMTRRVRRPTRDACELTVAGAGGGRGAVERGEVEKEEVEEEHKREEEEEEVAAEGRIRPGGFHRTALLSLLSADFLSTALRIYTPARPPASVRSR